MFETNTYKAVLDRMMGRVSNKLDKREGSVIFDAHAPAAMEFARLYVELERVLAETFGGTASREYLILRCAERGITPKAASCALFRAEAVPDSVDITGRRFNLGELNYIAERRLAPGVFEVRCETPGAAGGRYLGRLTPIDYVPGLERAELTGLLIPGADEEDTETLRARYFASFRETPWGGNQRDYTEKVNAIAGVGGCKARPMWNHDIRPADLIPPPGVSDWMERVRPGMDSACAAWLDAVYSAAAAKKLTVGGTVRVTIIDAAFGVPSAALIDAVQNALDPPENAGEGVGYAPIGHVVSAAGVRGVDIHIATRLTFAERYSFDNLRGALEEAVEAYLLELRRQWADGTGLIVRVSQIEMRLLAVPGVLDVGGTALNSAERNLTLGADEVPVFGSIQLS